MQVTMSTVNCNYYNNQTLIIRDKLIKSRIMMQQKYFKRWVSWRTRNLLLEQDQRRYFLLGGLKIKCFLALNMKTNLWVSLRTGHELRSENRVLRTGYICNKSRNNSTNANTSNLFSLLYRKFAKKHQKKLTQNRH